jgi:hypothetical protein
MLVLIVSNLSIGLLIASAVVLLICRKLRGVWQAIVEQHPDLPESEVPTLGKPRMLRIARLGDGPFSPMWQRCIRITVTEAGLRLRLARPFHWISSDSALILWPDLKAHRKRTLSLDRGRDNRLFLHLTRTDRRRLKQQAGPHWPAHLDERPTHPLLKLFKPTF